MTTSETSEAFARLFQRAVKGATGPEPEPPPRPKPKPRWGSKPEHYARWLQDAARDGEPSRYRVQFPRRAMWSGSEMEELTTTYTARVHGDMHRMLKAVGERCSAANLSGWNTVDLPLQQVMMFAQRIKMTGEVRDPDVAQERHRVALMIRKALEADGVWDD